MIHIKVPATSANMGPGFDCIGIALQLYNELWVEEIDSGIEIPRLGRSPDFDHRCPALPGLPVVFTVQLPYTVTASLRIHTGFPFHPPLGGHPDATILYFFQTATL